MDGTCPHSDSGTDVKHLIQDTHSHAYTLTYTCPSYTTSTHTFHKSCKPSPVIKRPSMRQSIRKQCPRRMALHCFCNKLLTTIMISKEQHDEHDNSTSYIALPSYTFFVSCPTSACWSIKSVDFETEKKKAFGFYFDESKCHWCWLKCEKWNWLRLCHHINHTRLLLVLGCTWLATSS